MLPSFRTQMFPMRKIEEGIKLRIYSKDDAPSISAISSIWSASWFVFLSEETDAPSSSVPGFDE
jgi:hypothetical protein